MTKISQNHLNGLAVTIADQTEAIQGLMEINAAQEKEITRLKEKYEPEVSNGSEPGGPLGTDEGSASGNVSQPGGT